MRISLPSGVVYSSAKKQRRIVPAKARIDSMRSNTRSKGRLPRVFNAKTGCKKSSGGKATSASRNQLLNVSIACVASLLSKDRSELVQIAAAIENTRGTANKRIKTTRRIPRKTRLSCGPKRTKRPSATAIAVSTRRMLILIEGSMYINTASTSCARERANTMFLLFSSVIFFRKGERRGWSVLACAALSSAAASAASEVIAFSDISAALCFSFAMVVHAFPGARPGNRPAPLCNRSGCNCRPRVPCPYYTVLSGKKQEKPEHFHALSKGN